MTKRKLYPMQELDGIIVQLLGGDKIGKLLVEEAILAYCEKKDIDVVVRKIVTSKVVKNYEFVPKLQTARAVKKFLKTRKK